jgi:rhomboid protease GluP
MDWSLVLISQEIATTVDYSEQEGGWGLLMATDIHERALEILRVYQIENRRWPWRSEVFQAKLVFDWLSLGWAFLVALFFLVESGSYLHDTGVMDSTAVAQGQWWRLFTAIWLHADLAHLATNTSLGILLVGLALGRFGTGAGLLACYLAGVGGNFAACALSIGAHRSLGASGMVMGPLGLIAAQSFLLSAHSPHLRKQMLAGVLGGVMLFVLFGLAPDSDILAHAGGFVSGFLLGAVMTQVGDIAHRGKLNLLCGLAFLALVVGPWWLALRHA